ncbi:MAG: CDP-glucose 4,6-dehydratase, partial [Bacteroidota bacterium]|nr:CDP-glucose 4,6-dehydratase [Bacteroidota bacterium]
MYNNVYANKKVLVIGNTGFKGSWLSIWLLKLGAEVYGISKDVPTTPSIFDELNLQEKINYQVADINDRDKILQLIDDLRPDFLFNLAAQPIVSKSYSEPIETINTNVLGTAHILEALRIINHNCIAVMITSDKCYENVEWIWGYKESDHLGGKDPYSASKGACEIIIHAYFHSYLKNSNVRLASVRAGNVIGGGDWAESRIVPDSMKAWSQNLPVTIRNPNSTRPWQHVLEPLSGYLRVGQKLKEEEKINGEAYNFGPSAEQVHTVAEMLEQLGEFWKFTTKQPKYIVQS